MSRAFGSTGARLLLVAFAVSTAFVAEPESRQASSASSPCDPKLIPSRGDPLAYGRRGERCEGLYVLEVAGSADLSLVAFTEAVRTPATTPEGRLHVQWAGTPGRLPVHLRAISLRHLIYYRMDVVRPEGAGRFEWPSADVVARLNLSPAEIGILGWVEQTVGSRLDHVYVPVRFSSAPEPAKGLYVARVVPGVELSQLLVTLATIGADGRDEQYVKRDEPLNYGFYPAARPISVRLPELPVPGLYRLTLGAILRSGGSATRTFIFYHPGSTT
jgi:hypothetical protein